MPTTKRTRDGVYQLYVRRAELHAVLDDLDDAERAADSFWSWHSAMSGEKEAVANLAALLRTRDAQAREAGRVEAIEDAIAGFKAKVKAGYDVPLYVFAELQNALDYLKRPDRAKGG